LDRTWSLSIALTVVLTAVDTWMLAPSLQMYLLPSAHFGPRIFVPRMLGLVAIAGVQVLFVRASLLAGPLWRLAAFLVFAAMTMFAYGWAGWLGDLPDPFELRMALRAPTFWMSVGSSTINWAGLVPLALFAVTLGFVRPMPSGHLRRFVAAMVLCVMVHSAYRITDPLDVIREVDDDISFEGQQPVPISAMQATARTVTLAAWSEWTDHIAQRGRGPRISVPSVPHREGGRHVVLVIDESMRGDRFSLNGYGRQTTAFLDGLAAQGRLVNWGIASSIRPLSAGAVACLLTGVRDLPDVTRLVESSPTLFQYAKAMGFQTHMLDGEYRHLRFGLESRDLAFIDSWRSEREFGMDTETDVRLADAIRALLARPERQFVVAFKRGNHRPFDGNVPPGLGRFSGGSGEFEESDEYDSGLAYNVDGFFRRLLQDGPLQSATVLYTSDHGELLPEDHQDGPIAWQQFAVPLLMLGDVPEQVGLVGRASHANVFATILDLMDYPQASRPMAYGQSLFDSGNGPTEGRLVFEGSFFGGEPSMRADFDALMGASRASPPPSGAGQ
jgi:glucan phosphoethanolaminetransferase (alkaline phosphatase superfamily)